MPLRLGDLLTARFSLAAYVLNIMDGRVRHRFVQREDIKWLTHLTAQGGNCGWSKRGKMLRTRSMTNPLVGIGLG